MANFFPRWTNTLPLKLIVCFVVIAAGISLGMNYYFTPKYTRPGYQPDQPIPFRHDLHVGQLGMDCRYCHSFVEQSGHANVPSSGTCWNCHQHIKKDSDQLKPLRDSIESGKPIEWVKIHQVPDYAYFNHSVHVSSGISCVECHGNIDDMRVVYHHEPQSMGWCLDCHRNPEDKLRPLDKITNLKWKAEDQGKKQDVIGKKIKENWHIDAPENCAACHR